MVKRKEWCSTSHFPTERMLFKICSLGPVEAVRVLCKLPVGTLISPKNKYRTITFQSHRAVAFLLGVNELLRYRYTVQAERDVIVINLFGTSIANFQLFEDCSEPCRTVAAAQSCHL